VEELLGFIHAKSVVREFVANACSNLAVESVKEEKLFNLSFTKTILSYYLSLFTLLAECHFMKS
jgi:hypothetical protein